MSATHTMHLPNAYAAPIFAPNPVKRVILAIAVRRQRRSLARLDARMLCDIGLTRNDALREMRRAVWDF